MTSMTNYAKNKYIDARFRGQALGAPATSYFALLVSSRGPRQNSILYAVNDTISVLADDGKLHLYKCTTGGTSAASQGALYSGAYDQNVTDGGAVFAEQGPELDDGTALVEASYTGYARVGVASSLANFAGTQAAGSTVASTGSSGQTSNNGVVTFGPPTAGATNYAWGVALFDAPSGGNAWEHAPLTAPKTINPSDAAPALAAAAFTFTLS